MPTYQSKSHCDPKELWLCWSTRSSGATRFLKWEMDRILAVLRGPAGLATAWLSETLKPGWPSTSLVRPCAAQSLSSKSLTGFARQA